MPWTAPDDFALDLAAPAEGLQTGSDGRWLAGFADGSVSRLLGDISPDTILHLF